MRLVRFTRQCGGPLVVQPRAVAAVIECDSNSQLCNLRLIGDPNAITVVGSLVEVASELAEVSE